MPQAGIEDTAGDFLVVKRGGRILQDFEGGGEGGELCWFVHG